MIFKTVGGDLWHALYEWSTEKGWQVVREPEKLTPGGTDEQSWFKRYPDDPELLRDPEGWALREARRVLQELREGTNSARHDERHRGGYILRTGKPRWSVGCIDRGFNRGPTVDSVPRDSQE